MKRKILMVVLGLGAIAGFAAGFARLCHGPGHWGHGGWRSERHAAFEKRVADVCTAAALRASKAEPAPGAKP